MSHDSPALYRSETKARHWIWPPSLPNTPFASVVLPPGSCTWAFTPVAHPDARPIRAMGDFPEFLNHKLMHRQSVSEDSTITRTHQVKMFMKFQVAAASITE